MHPTTRDHMVMNRRLKRKSYLIVATILFGLCALLAGKPTLSAQSGYSPELSEEIVNRIIEKNIGILQKYRGVASLQRSITQVFNSETGEVTETVELKTLKKSYFQEPSETTVLEYKKNGIIEDPEDYKEDKRPPAYQVFDQKSRERFDYKVAGTKEINNQNCYILKVLPRQNTERHFKGTVYVNTDSLNTVYLEGTIADYPFGLKDMNMTFTFESLGELYAFKKATIELFIHVPIIKPNTRILITTDSLQNKPIPR